MEVHRRPAVDQKGLQVGEQSGLAGVPRPEAARQRHLIDGQARRASGAGVHQDALL